ncbi:MAG: glycosyltransferase family 4 protein [Candidatus Thermoplasmatota archaeon]|nr:glycosyltransferase family 4 protein [Candidatus Thermoplasmatota archaeon]
MGFKLLMVNGFYYPYSGGTEKHMYELSRRLARDREVHVLTSLIPEADKREEDVEGVHVHRVKSKLKKIPGLYPPPYPRSKEAREAVARLDKEHDFDFINLHGRWFPDFANSFWYAKEKGKTSVLTIHNARPVGISPMTTLGGTIYENIYGKRVMRKADHFIPVSNAVKEDLTAYGLDKNRMHVIHNGVDCDFFKPSEPIFRDEWLEGADHAVMFLGRLIKQKGLDTMLKAIPIILKEHPRTRFVIVGRGNQKEFLEREIRKKGLEKNVLFPGFVEEEKLASLYSSCDIYLLPSLWEVCPISLLEALGCGCACVASTAGGNPEIVSDGTNGFIFPKGEWVSQAEKINILLSDQNLRKKMGQASRKRAVDMFDWNIITKKTIELYNSLL